MLAQIVPVQRFALRSPATWTPAM